MPIKQAPGAPNKDQARGFFRGDFYKLNPPQKKAKKAAAYPGDLPQSESVAGLPDSYGDSGIHLPLSDDRTAGLRHALPRLRSRPQMRGTQESENLYLGLPRPGRLP